MKINPRVVRRSPNPNHHIWNNNGTFYVHFTAYPTPVTKERFRQSLNTHDVHKARGLRDEILKGLEIIKGRI